MREAMKREALYAEFIIEVSKRRVHAWSHQAETPEVLAGLYSALERMRLTSPDEVRQLAEKVVLHVMEAYAAPDRSFDEQRQNLDKVAGNDPLKNFSEACRRCAPDAQSVGSTSGASWSRLRAPRCGTSRTQSARRCSRRFFWTSPNRPARVKASVSCCNSIAQVGTAGKTWLCRTVSGLCSSLRTAPNCSPQNTSGSS
jgi:hypothetical protein